MLQKLNAGQLNLKLRKDDLGFDNTAQLIGKAERWIGQATAEKAANFGLSVRQPGFHLLVLGEQGSGRRSIMLQAMAEVAEKLPPPADLIGLSSFRSQEKPRLLRVNAGSGAAIRNGLDQFARLLARTITNMFSAQAENISAAADDPVAKAPQQHASSRQIELELPITPEESASSGDGQSTAQHKNQQPEQATGSAEDVPDIQSVLTALLQEQVPLLQALIASDDIAQPVYLEYLTALKRDVMQHAELFPLLNAETDSTLESFLNRYRANLLIGYSATSTAPVIYDNDPSLQSLFGGIEGSSDQGGAADFLRLRAGNLLRAHNGMLLLHLRDLQQDQDGSQQLLEKLHRFLRNNSLRIEDLGQSNATLASECLPVETKVVLIASHDEYYQLLDNMPELAGYFRIKVDFVDSFAATPAIYQALSAYIAKRCVELGLRHFNVAAVIRLLRALHREIDDQARISSRLGELDRLLIESAAMALFRNHSQGPDDVVDAADVEAAIKAEEIRHESAQTQTHDAIIDGEQIIGVHGSVIGQINGLTYMDLDAASFGSPVRISARCYAGTEGVINVGREVAMSGPNHDKGVFILKNWLAASFSHLAPLSLSASLVFEQEYFGVEGDSASCAELYALLSALSGLALPQGMAITGALNQHGEVMPVGGINEKIEGYFRICQRIGLDGSQGVIIPQRNQRHLLLKDEVIHAVEQGQFHIYTITHVLDGISHLTGITAGDMDGEGGYPADSVMGRVQRQLEIFQRIWRHNRQPWLESGAS